ncbi:hypothetical protein L208DRAFT_400932 [Tricholoma matsutake]|nr:hypothetical protein L208DRAFT_731742 [Tricholoma matsutake 945]KAF8225945.1 hypothetical protein L208DRAFT_400932 [Tricholoma matsutake 945]
MHPQVTLLSVYFLLKLLCWRTREHGNSRQSVSIMARPGCKPRNYNNHGRRCHVIEISHKKFETHILVVCACLSQLFCKLQLHRTRNQLYKPKAR